MKTPIIKIHGFSYEVECVLHGHDASHPFDTVEKALLFFNAQIPQQGRCDARLYLVNSLNHQRHTLAWYQGETLHLHESTLLEVLRVKEKADQPFFGGFRGPKPIKFTDEYPSHLAGKVASFEVVGEKYPPLLTVQCEPVKDHLVVSTYSSRPTKPYVSGRLYTKEEAKAKAIELLEADKAGADFHVAKIVADVVQKKTEEITYKLVDR